MIVFNPPRKGRKSKKKASARRKRNYRAPMRFARKTRPLLGITANPHSWAPEYASMAMNPGGGVISKVTSGFQPRNIVGLLPIAGGALINRWVSPKIASRLPSGWDAGWRGAVVGTVASGLIGGVTGALSPKMGAKVFAGALMQTATNFLLPFFGNLMPATADQIDPVGPPVKVGGMGKHSWAPEYAEMNFE